MTVHRILDGVSEHTSHYGLFIPFPYFHRLSLLTGAAGLELARLADLPSDILQEGHRVAEKLAELQKKQEEESEGSQIALRRKVLLRVSAPQPSTREYTQLTINIYDHEFIAPNSAKTGAKPFDTSRRGSPGVLEEVPRGYCQRVCQRIAPIRKVPSIRAECEQPLKLVRQAIANPLCI